MDSQQAAFEKFKASSHGGSRESRHGARDYTSEPVPELYSIHRGKVVRVEDYGAFIQIPGFKKQGLVHKSQASRHFTEKISDVVEVGDSVWVKVTSLQDDKISLSMKHVQQGSGEDLDPNLVQLTGDTDKRRAHTEFVDKAPISIEQGGVLFKTVCKKCGAMGHLANECFSGGEKFELLDDDQDDLDDSRNSRISGQKKDHDSSSKQKKKKKAGREKEKERSSRESHRDRDSKDRDRERDRDNKDRDRERDYGRDRERERDQRDQDRHGHRERRYESSSFGPRHGIVLRPLDRSPKRRSEMAGDSTKVESLEDALAVIRAHKVSLNASSQVKA
ncbi:Nucleolar protein of 40 kDa [Podila epigama]|nr:Nucleolar protein of 40 kDa [Podila epigama]